MHGFQVTFHTVEGRQHAGRPIARWLMDTAAALGIRGSTLTTASEGTGRHGRLHSAHFLELADQPVQVTLAVDPHQCEQLFALLEREQVNLFYVKMPVEFGVVGAPSGPAE